MQSKNSQSENVLLGYAKRQGHQVSSQSVTFTAQEGTLFLKLDQGSGVEVRSKQPLTLTAYDTITFAGKSISMGATESCA